MINDSQTDRLWVFMGEGASHPAAVFSPKGKAEEWFQRCRVSGVLTSYPLDQSVYEWAVAEQHFTPKYPSQLGSDFIQRFTSAYAEHYHFDGGVETGKAYVAPNNRDEIARAKQKDLLPAELWSHFWPICDCRELEQF